MPANSFDSKHFVRNITKLAFSNFVIIFAGVINGFVIPKIMTITDYGYYKVFSLYASYITLLHLGFIDGILLLFAGRSFDDLEKESFRLYSRFLISLESIIALLVVIVALFLDGMYKYIFIMLSINIIALNISLYFQYISQVTERFSELSLRNIIRSFLNIFSAFSLFVLYKLNNQYISSYLYIAIVVLINVFLMSWYLFTYKELVFGPAKGIKTEYKSILHIFREGVPYSAASFLASLMLTIDRQFVSILFVTEVYAVYAFAYNMLALITTATGAISTVVYPALKKRNDSIINVLPYYREIISLIVSYSLCSYFILIKIINVFLPKYSGSLAYFYIILPGLIFSSVVTIVLSSFFKIEFKQLVYLCICLCTIIMSIIMNVVFFKIYGTTQSISWASTLMMIFWYIVANLYFYYKYKIGFIKNFVFCIIISILFYIFAKEFEWGIGLFLFALCISLINYIFHRKTIERVLGK